MNYNPSCINMTNIGDLRQSQRQIKLIKAVGPQLAGLSVRFNIRRSSDLTTTTTFWYYTTRILERNSQVRCRVKSVFNVLMSTEEFLKML